MYSHLIFGLLTATVYASPIANDVEAREALDAVATKTAACVLPSNATNIDTAATKVVRATPTSFQVYDASSDSFAVAPKGEDDVITFKSAHGSHFAIDPSNDLQILDYGTTDKNGTFHPDYAGQRICGVGCHSPYIAHVTASDLAVGHGPLADGDAESVRCRISFNKDGTCPLVCRGHGTTSQSCDSDNTWAIGKGSPGEGCVSAVLYAVST